MKKFIWKDIIIIIEEMFDLKQIEIADKLNIDKALISKLKNQKIAESEHFNPKNIYDKIFNPTEISANKLNEQFSYSLLKETLEKNGFRDIMSDLWTDESNKYKNGDYEKFARKMLDRTTSNTVIKEISATKNNNISCSDSEVVLDDNKKNFVVEKKSAQIRQSHLKKPEIFGRKMELDIIKERLEKNNYALITGIGGIGKSRVALEYAFKQQQNGFIVQLISCEEHDSLRNAIERLEFIGLNHNSLEFHQIVALLKGCQQPSLIIFDNLNRRFSPDDFDDFKKLMSCNLNIKYIFTSRDKNLLPLSNDEHIIWIKPIFGSV